MDGSRSLKRPSDGEPSESSQRQRVEGHASGGFGLGPAGRGHLRFTDTTQEVHNQAIPSRYENFGQPAELREITPINLINAYKEVLDEYPDTLKISNFSKECQQLSNKCREGKINDIRRTLQEWKNLPEDNRNISNKRKRKLAKILLNKAHNQAGSSRQGDAQLDPKDRKTIEDYTKLILSDDAKIWSNSIGDVDIKYKEARRHQQETGQTQVTSSQSLPEIRQPLDKEKKEVIDIPSNSDSESDHGRTDHQADISKAREEHIKKVIDNIMEIEKKFTRKNIKQFLKDNKLCDTDYVEIAIKHLKEKWSSHKHSNRYNNIIFAINGIE